jgi:hypothetical protein
VPNGSGRLPGATPSFKPMANAIPALFRIEIDSYELGLRSGIRRTAVGSGRAHVLPVLTGSLDGRMSRFTPDG